MVHTCGHSTSEVEVEPGVQDPHLLRGESEANLGYMGPSLHKKLRKYKKTTQLCIICLQWQVMPLYADLYLQ